MDIFDQFRNEGEANSPPSRQELENALNSIPVSPLDQVSFPGKTAKQIREIKATKQRQEADQFEQATMRANINRAREEQRRERDLERQILLTAAKAISPHNEQQTSPAMTAKKPKKVRTPSQTRKDILAKVIDRVIEDNPSFAGLGGSDWSYTVFDFLHSADRRSYPEIVDDKPGALILEAVGGGKPVTVTVEILRGRIGRLRKKSISHDQATGAPEVRLKA